jgi:hypothetical protein
MARAKYPNGQFLWSTVLICVALAACGGGGSGVGQVSSESLAFAAPSYPVSQSSSTAQLSVARSGTPSGAVSVSYTSADGTAVAGTDYTRVGGTLQWGDGDGAPKMITVSISDTTAFTGNRSFSISLSEPSSGVTLGTPSSAAVVIAGAGGAPPGSVAWVYYASTFNWGGDYSYNAVINYSDTSGAPLSGHYDIAVTINGAYGAWQPYAGGTVPMWNFIDTGYTYLTFAIKPTVASQSAQVYFTEVGDIPVGVDVDPFSGRYGPPPQAGVWSTYKIPLTDLGVANSSVYKFAIQDQTGLDSNLFYLDNVGFE